MNSAGRSSGFHSYKRMVCDALSESDLAQTWLDLAHRMGLNTDAGITPQLIDAIKDGTLIRSIETFDPDNVNCHHKVKVEATNFIIHKSKLPKTIPPEWHIEELENNELRVTASQPVDMLLPDTIKIDVTSAGGIPRGFDPGALYNSHHHPRGIKLAVYGASDALNSLGMEWAEVLTHIKPDEVSVYAGSGLGQIDNDSLIGLISRPLEGSRISSKMLPLSLAEMPADFVNSYILNSVGSTGTNMGACATFLYNLRQGMTDIQTGRAKVVLVGNAEAPIVPDLIQGFSQMGALAKDADLCALDNSDTVDHRRACRPFSTNTGFTISEATQFVILMSDELALELGVTIYGSVADIFISADANKKSITAPGIGNYVTVAKAAALAKAMLGQEGLERTFVQSHGTGTPLNRTTESHILNEVAKTFSIKNWPVTAIKSYIGHSVSVAAGDQIVTSLGVWQYGWIPGIKTIDHIADDVYRSNLNILTDHYFAGEKGSEIDAVLVNSKGFGGNNATGLILSPTKTLEMLESRYGKEIMTRYQEKNASVRARIAEKDEEATQGREQVIYTFGKSVMDASHVSMTTTTLSLAEFGQAIQLPQVNPYPEYQNNGTKKTC